MSGNFSLTLDLATYLCLTGNIRGKYKQKGLPEGDTVIWMESLGAFSFIMIVWLDVMETMLPYHAT